jgi:hypothetical protein
MYLQRGGLKLDESAMIGKTDQETTSGRLLGACKVREEPCGKS